MTKRDEMFAVIRDRTDQAVHHIAEGHRSWLWNRRRWHFREARRLLALNERDLDRLPPERYRKPRPGPVQVRHD